MVVSAKKNSIRTGTIRASLLVSLLILFFISINIGVKDFSFRRLLQGNGSDYFIIMVY